MLDPPNSEDLFFSTPAESLHTMGGLKPAMAADDRKLREAISVVVDSKAYQGVIEKYGQPFEAAVNDRSATGDASLVDVFLGFIAETPVNVRIQLLGSHVHFAGVIDRWPGKRTSIP